MFNLYEMLNTKESVFIGSSSENDIVFNDPQTSPRHCQISKVEPGVYLIVDLNSVRGTYINNERIRTGFASDTDLIKVGNNVFQVIKILDKNAVNPIHQNPQPEPVEPVKRVIPVKHPESPKPVESVKPVKDAEPAETLRSAKPVKPVETVKYTEPPKPIEPAMVAEPVKPPSVKLYDDTAKKYEELKLRMTVEATNIIAASIIAEPDFPNINKLPAFRPLPFNNFGHFFLFDHSRFLQIIYQTVKEAQNIFKPLKNQFTKWYISAGVVAVIFLILFLVDEYILLYYLGVLVLGIIVPLMITPDLKAKYESFADYKAGIMENLLNNNWVKNDGIKITSEIEKSLSASSNCIVPNNEMLVLVMIDDKQPFPGFGRLQLSDKFICPPKNLNSVISIDEIDLFQKITEKLQTFFRESGIQNIGFRKVIALNSNSIGINSSWLDESKTPILTKIISERDIAKYDPKASVRLFLLIEILFPKYDSAACFFIRPFKAENSAGWHISITTMGPPQLRQQYLQERLRKHTLEKLKTFDDKTSSNVLTDSYINSLQAIENKVKYSAKFVEKFLTRLDKVDFFSEKVANASESDRESKRKEIISNEVFWPGKYRYWQYNIREWKSLTFGGDFFGYPELISSISTIYEQLSQQILEVIQTEGFDISKYKDKEGKFTINADNINKIVMGEVINMQSGEEKKKESTPLKNVKVE